MRGASGSGSVALPPTAGSPARLAAWGHPPRGGPGSRARSLPFPPSLCPSLPCWAPTCICRWSPERPDMLALVKCHVRWIPCFPPFPKKREKAEPSLAAVQFPQEILAFLEEHATARRRKSPGNKKAPALLLACHGPLGGGSRYVFVPVGTNGLFFSLGKFIAAGGPCPRGVPGPPIAAGRSLTSVRPPGKQRPGQPRHRPRAGERSRGWRLAK